MEHYFIHKEWNDICIIHKDTNYIYRKNVKNEKGYFEEKNNKMIIKWDKWTDKDEFEKRKNMYIDLKLLNNHFKVDKIILVQTTKKEDCFLIDNNVISYKKNINGILEKINTIYVITWNNKLKEEYIYKNDKYYLLDYYLQNNHQQNKKQIINNYSFEFIENIEQNKENNKNIFKKINNCFYNVEYIQKFIQKKYKLKIIEQSSIYSHNKNNNELYFNYLNLINQDYIDLDNYKQYYYHYNIKNENINDNFFSFESNIIMNIENNKKNIITLCEWGYPPFGGGENWLLNINKLFHEMDYQTFMICFSDGFTNKPFEEFNYIELEYIKIIQIPFDYFEIAKLIYLLKPVFINHQGVKRLKFMKLANIFEIPFFTGFCFWNNIIEQLYSNLNILENKEIKSDPSFHDIIQNSFCYSASEFVNDVIKKFFNQELPIIHTISLKDDYYIEKNEEKYVSLVNCHHNKGGFLLKELIQNLNINIPLLFVYTEYDHHISLSEIKQLLNERNDKNNINILYTEKQDIKKIYKKTKIMLIPSLCDETFCRVAYECKMNQIPIISTNSGNLKYLMKDYALILDTTISSWIKNIEKIYFNHKKNNKINNNKLIEKNENNTKNNITTFIQKFNKSKYNLNEKHIGIIAPWADQGLGIQARSYYHTLKEIDFIPFIFSFKPYHGNKENNFLQNEPKEWDLKNIYYSEHHREQIEVDELIQFIWKNKIKKILIIEATFEPIFKLISFLKLIGIEIYIIINIECIKITEISYHLLFNKIFTNNYNSYHIMNNLIPNKCHHLGFHLEHEMFKLPIKSKKKNKILNFVCIGGLNSISRKNIDKLLQVFLEILNEYKINYIYLNIYIQGVEIPPLLNNIHHNQIKINIHNFSYQDNLNNIKKNDICIHLGCQEGLGLGFYEALYLGLPILTLNWTPNNELIFHYKNGWLVNCTGSKVYENNECLIKKGTFELNDLNNTLLDIINNIDETINIINNTIDYSKKFRIKNKKQFNENFKFYLSSRPSFY